MEQMAVTAGQLFAAALALPPIEDRRYWPTERGRRYLLLLEYMPSALASWAETDARGSDEHSAQGD